MVGVQLNFLYTLNQSLGVGRLNIGIDIQVASVTPIPEQLEVFQQTEVPAQVTLFYRYNNVCRFQFDLRINRENKDSDNEFKVRVITIGSD